MKLKFISDTEVKQIARGRKARYDWAAVIEELYKHPNQWAEVPFQVVNASSAYILNKRFADIEIMCTGGNGLPEGHPEGKLWTVYLRYTPKEG